MVELSGLALAAVESTSTISRSSVYLGGFFDDPCANRLCTSPEGLRRGTKKYNAMIRGRFLHEFNKDMYVS